MLNKSTLSILSIVFFVQLFCVNFYWNDKTTTAARLITSMENNHSIYAKNFACFEKDGGVSNYATWGEEPPVFHLVGLAFKQLMGDWSLKILPLLCYVFLVIGFSKILNSSEMAVVLLLSFIPSLYIHASRFIPDVMAMALALWGIHYFLSKKYNWAFLLLTLAVTSKALVIIPLFFLCGATLLFDSESRSSKGFFSLLAFGLTIIPTLLWFYYLSHNHIENPFFVTDVNLAYNAGGSNWAVLARSKYWSKVFQWYFYRGIGLSLLGLCLYGVFSKKIILSTRMKIVGLTALMFLPNVILLRSAQTTAPWYSFYFQIFFIIFGMEIFKTLEKKKQWALCVLQVLITIGFLKYNFNFSPAPYAEAAVQVPCHFHEYQAQRKSEI